MPIRKSMLHIHLIYFYCIRMHSADTVCIPTKSILSVKSSGQELKGSGWKRCEIKKGGQGLLLLMELFLIIMPQNIVFLFLIIKNLNSINSTRPWPPFWFHIFFSLTFFSSWLLLAFLHPGFHFFFMYILLEYIDLFTHTIYIVIFKLVNLQKF